MLRVSRAGAIVLPAAPGFYHRPATVDALIDFVVARILDQLGIPQTIVAPWSPGRDPADRKQIAGGGDDLPRRED